MKKLNKAEILYIDNYLIKNEVKYWDVRTELLDHIVSAVEEKIDKEGISFNEALLDVHEGFGNKLGHYKNPSFEKQLYYSNIGFKKLLKTKRKEIRRKLNKNYWKSFIPYVFSTRFLLEFIALVLLVLTVYRYHQKAAFLVAMCCACIPEFIKLFYSIAKASRKSLNMQMAIATGSLFMSLNYFFIEVFNSLFKDVFPKPYVFIIVFYLLLFPFLRHSLNIYISTLRVYKERYKLMLS
ncbi:hypothetical protein [Flavivirga spongiicola]|uniref:Uncharacterized protein n=1 Tax=Flavivirga spongiicola TaxID=421621 RepID=A0ABU7XSV4_9FLAO|nr:hypothetical protein [Flavivirga sp. MEBiC05379]MDO5978823.1 hypothetical protein [Flavivirga sp. MEBiC05379]